MKKIIYLSTLLLLSTIVFSQTQMTGRKTQVIYGDASKVVYSDGKFIEFNKDGNIVKKKLNDDTYEYKYVSANRYISFNDYYNVIFKGNKRIEKWDNPNEDLSTDYTFDSSGRIKQMDKADYGQSLCIEYFYKDKELLPFKIVESERWEEGTEVVTSLYTYTKVDNDGNWLTCNIERKVEGFDDEDKPTPIKTEKLSQKRTISYYTKSELSKKETYNAKESSTKTAANNDNETFIKSDWMMFIIIISIFLLFIAHMIFVNFIRGKRYKITYSAEYFKQLRVSKGLSDCASDEEDSKACSLLSQAFDKWPVVEKTEEDEFRTPKRISQIKSAAALIDQAILIAPTDVDTIDRLNEFTDVVNSNEKRIFFGSKALIVVSALVGLLLGYAVSYEITVYIILGIIAYILASRAPVFLVEKRIEKKRGSLSAGVFAVVAAMISGARTIRTTTTWSDGSKTVKDDDSEHWFAYIVGFFVMVILGVYIYLWAFVNYLRNYIFYI